MIIQSNIKEVPRLDRENTFKWTAWALESAVEIQAEVSDTIFEHPPAVATSLPSEIIDDVLSWADDSYYFSSRNALDQKLRKKELGQLSLTCKHWAGRCRWRMFDNLRISSLEDLHTLRDWAERLEDLLQSFAVNLEGPTKPWLHLFRMPSQSPLPRWDHRFNIFGPAIVNLYVDIEKVLSQRPQRSPRFRSLLYSVPRFIPCSLSHVHSLHLSNHHFSSFFDLVHLVGELLHLNSLEVKNLSWDVPSEMLASLNTRCIRSSLRYIEAEECTDAHNLIWLYAIYGLKPSQDSDGHAGRMGIQARAELPQIAELTRQFLKSDIGARGSEEVVVDSGSSLRTPIYRLFVYDSMIVRAMSVDNLTEQNMYLPWKSRIGIYGWLANNYLIIQYKAVDPLENDLWPGNSSSPSPTSPNSPLNVSIGKLELHSTPEMIYAYPAELLEELDRQADSFPHLEHFHVQFRDRGREHKMVLEEWSTQCVDAAGEIAQRMTRMQKSGKLQFDFWDWKHCIFQTVTPSR